MFTMEKYAVIKFASKQYLVREGDVIELERQEKPLKIEVLFYCDGQKNTIGEPEVKGISVKAVILEDKIGKKVRVARFKKKSRYERVRGHRQPMSLVKIEKIGSSSKDEEVTDKKEEELVEKSTKVTEEKAIKKVSTEKKLVSEKEKKTIKKTVSKKPTAKKLKGSK